MLKKILIALAVIIVVFVVVVAVQPSEFRVTRSATMAAPAAAAFEQVNDLHKWEAWSPWAKLDPAAKNTFEGPPAGKGAVFAWAGNNQIGEGRMTITESRTNELVRFNLEFFKPMAGTSTSEFMFKSDGSQTTVTWSMDGKNNFIAKAMCLFMNMDKMLGGEFEKGLASIQSIVENAPKR
ncbi:MAG: SRPBCC family protein [Verrucomicrobia bacterium]|nr:SRPBCC family protein [Verrucomicrobiota bacterium]